MKIKSAFYTVLLTGILMILLFNCKKEAIKTIPVVTVSTVTNITATTATSIGEITSDGGSTITSRGICWSSTNPTPTSSDSKTNNSTGLGSFTGLITGLTPGVTYYLRAYASNSVGTAYSSQITFVTLALAPILTTTELSVVTSTSANSGGNITNNGGSPVLARGICWGIAQSPTTANFKTTDGTGSGIFTSVISGLTPGGTYYVRAYATNSIGTAYGNQVTLITIGTLSTLTTTAVSAITATTAASGGNITTDGGVTITARGVCWSTTTGPTTASSKTTDGTGKGSFTSTISGLTPVTTYYVRAYATNSIGTAYGNQVNLITTATLSTLTTTAVSAITTTTATSGGNITINGGAAITARGVCWSTTTGPTTVSSKTTDGTGTGSFTSAITGLTSGSTYYLRAYASNGLGTAYGSQVTFTTTSGSGGTATDFNGYVYKTIQIGTQTWMAENLKTTNYRNGDPIPHEFANESWAPLAPNTGAYSDAGYFEEGFFYNWFAITDSRNIAPVGWHVPTDAEWTTLTDYLGGSIVAGGKLKEAGTDNWLTPNNGATNSTSFTGLPSGLRGNGDGTYYGKGYSGNWWSSTVSNGWVWTRVLGCYDAKVSRGIINKESGISVRCVKD